MKKYCPVWDAYYDPSGVWLEFCCGDEDCPYKCLERPKEHDCVAHLNEKDAVGQLLIPFKRHL